MPGYLALSQELGVNHKTVRAALTLLKEQGLLEPQGAGRRPRILLTDDMGIGSLRVRVLPFDLGDRTSRHMLDLMHHLHSTRHTPDFARCSLWCLKMDVERIARFVAKNPADAWVVCAGSKDVLQWFAEQSVPSFALMGRLHGVKIPGAKPDKLQASREALRRLVDLGHRRIVKLVLEDQVKPTPNLVEQTFLDDMKALGLPVGSYNLCTWNGEPKELYVRLDALFRHTPPTALFLDAVSVFHTARDHLARRGILAPDQVSLVCYDPEPAFLWTRPSVAHIDWSFQPLAQRIVRWLENVASGKDDRRQTFSKATFIDGGTIGPVAVRSSPGR
jgi:DNA-binding LacI/PurR family transcriptional regulator